MFGRLKTVKCFSTKNQGQKLYKHLIDYSNQNFQINFERLNIQPEHIHGLIDLPTNVMLSEYMQKLKGESSHWLNEIRIFTIKFSWQRGFGVYSVSASQLEIVKRYIENQTQHLRESTRNGKENTEYLMIKKSAQSGLNIHMVLY